MREVSDIFPFHQICASNATAVFAVVIHLLCAMSISDVSSLKKSRSIRRTEQFPVRKRIADDYTVEHNRPQDWLLSAEELHHAAHTWVAGWHGWFWSWLVGDDALGGEEHACD